MKSGSRLFVIISLAAIAAAATLVYASTWSDAFLADDWVNLLHSKNLTFSTFVRNCSFVPEDIYYRPVAIGYFYLNYALWGFEPAGHHVVRGLLFAATAALLFIFILRATGLRIAALAAGLVFALHPMNASCAIWLATHATVLSPFFYLLTLVLFVEVRKRERFNLLLYAGFLVSMILCLGSYELGYTLPAALILTEILLLWRKTGESAGSYWKKAWRAHLPYLVLAAAFFTLRFVYMGMLTAENTGGEVKALAVAMTAFMPVSVMDSNMPFLVRMLPALAGLGFFAAILRYGKGLRRPAIFGALLAVVGAIPVLGAINGVPAFSNTRLLVISMTGFGIFIGCCVSLLRQWRAGKVAGAISLAALLAVYTWLDVEWREKWSLVAGQSETIIKTVTERCRGESPPFRLVFLNYPDVRGVINTEPHFAISALLAEDVIRADQRFIHDSPYSKASYDVNLLTPDMRKELVRWFPVRLDSLELYDRKIFKPSDNVYKISDEDLDHTFFFYWNEEGQKLVDCSEQMRKRLTKRASARPAKLFEWSAAQALPQDRIKVVNSEWLFTENTALYFSPVTGERVSPFLIIEPGDTPIDDFDLVEIDLSASSKSWREGYFTGSVGWLVEGEVESAEMFRRVKFGGTYHEFHEGHHIYRIPLAQRFLDNEGKRVTRLYIMLSPMVKEYALKSIRLLRFDE